jgi:outer membrane protein assembly factor BamB
MSNRSAAAWATLGLILCPLASAAEASWPQWRGPGGLGVAPDAGYPSEWSPAKNVAWKAEVLGRGLSSPVVAGGRIFLTTSIEGEAVADHKAPVHLGFDMRPGYLHPDSVGSDHRYTLKVLAFDAVTGRQIWATTAYEGPMYDDRHRKNTYASPTIATDGTLVYAFFESAGLYCYDLDGKLKWQLSFGGLAKAGLGPGTSPVIYEKLLLLQCDQEMGAGSFIAAIDRFTGKEAWRTPRSNRRSWATPILVQANGRVELVAMGAEAVVAYDPSTGRELWRANGTESHPIPSPVAGHGLVFATAGSQAKRALAIRVGGSGDLKDSPSVVWKHTKGTAYVPSPILLGAHLYLMTDKGIVTCLDARTGELVYEGGRVPVPATFTASPVAFGERLLLTSEDGDTFAIKAGPAFEVLGTSSVGEPVYASPALAGGRIFIRGERHLFAIGR